MQPGFQDEHKQIYTQWRTTRIEEDASTLFKKLSGWWASRKVADKSVPYMECWLSWWHMRYLHWQKYFSTVCY